MNQVPDAVLNAVLNTGWQAAAITIAVWGLLKVTRASAATRNLIWWAVLAMLVAMPLSVLRFDQAPVVWTSIRSQAVTAESHSVSIETATVTLAPAREGGPVRWRPGNWPAILMTACAAGFLVQCVRIARSYRFVQRVRRDAEPAAAGQRGRLEKWLTACRIRRPVELLVSGTVLSPMAVGFRRPAIILPKAVLGEFQELELDHVLLHELAHLVRRDDWGNLAARIAGGLLAFHPIAMWVLNRIAREQEIACDDWVVAVTGAPRPYAACLARLFDLCFSRRRVLLASGMAAGGSQLGERIEGLLRRRREFPQSASLVRVAAAVAVLGILVVAGARAPRWIAFAQDAPRRGQPVRVQTVSSPAGSPKGLLAALVEAGYGSLQVDDIIALKVAGVGPEYILGVGQSGWDKLTPRQMIDLKNQGVSPQYLTAAHESGIANLAVTDLPDLRNHGVKMEEVREIHSLGFGPYNKRQLIDLWTQGVRPDLFHALKDAGLTHVEVGEIVEARQTGLRARDLSEARQYGPSMTFRQILKLKRAGVLQ